MDSKTAPHVPTVTTADLLAFHEHAFGSRFAGEAVVGGQPNQHPTDQTTLQEPGNANAQGHGPRADQHYYQQDEEEEEEEEDDLGYYPDGVKRTLTDEQIAMFRHTEIQTILRERRLAREAAAAEAEEAEAAAEMEAEAEAVSPGEVREKSGKLDDHEPQHTVTLSGSGLAADNLAEKAKLAAANPATVSSGHSKVVESEDGEEEEEEEYARFLQAERQEFQRAAAARRNGERTAYYDAEDRTISTRRRVREMDDLHTAGADVLTYDEEVKEEDDSSRMGSKATPATKANSEVAAANVVESQISDVDAQPDAAKQGRSIWWPEIRSGS